MAVEPMAGHQLRASRPTAANEHCGWALRTAPGVVRTASATRPDRRSAWSSGRTRASGGGTRRPAPGHAADPGLMRAGGARVLRRARCTPRACRPGREPRAARRRPSGRRRPPSRSGAARRARAASAPAGRRGRASRGRAARGVRSSGSSVAVDGAARSSPVRLPPSDGGLGGPSPSHAPRSPAACVAPARRARARRCRACRSTKRSPSGVSAPEPASVSIASAVSVRQRANRSAAASASAPVSSCRRTRQ